MNHVIKTSNSVGVFLSASILYSVTIHFLLQNSDYSNDRHRKPGGLVLSNSNDDRYTDDILIYNEINFFLPQAGWLM